MIEVCPNCEVTLQVRTLEGTEVAGCDFCDGIWVTWAARHGALEGVTEIEVTSAAGRTLRCPADGFVLHPARIEARPGWTCAECQGLFLPAGTALAFGLRPGPHVPPAAPPRPERPVSGKGPITCVACQSAMQPFFVGEVEVDRCLFCGSVWLDDGELEQLVTQAAAMGAAYVAGARDCPACGEGLEPRSLAGVVIDQCPACHGVFLDPNELESLTRGQVAYRMKGRGDDRLDPDLSFVCPGCAERFALNEGLATGAGLVCSSCHGAFDMGRGGGGLTFTDDYRAPDTLAEALDTDFEGKPNPNDVYTTALLGIIGAIWKGFGK